MSRKRFWLMLLAVALLLTLPLLALADECPSEDAKNRNNGQHFWNQLDTTMPWCEEPGKAYYGCAYCGQVREEITSPALGHDWGPWEGEEPTCTEDGFRQRICRRCQTYDVEEMHALGHEFGDWFITVPSTCKVAGQRGHTCVRCGYSEYETLPLGDHVFGQQQIIEEPGCTYPGVAAVTCTVCGVSMTTDVPPLGHSGRWASGMESTCVVHGTRSLVCERCGEILQTEELPLIDHQFGAWVTTREPQVGVPGQRQRSCWMCGLTQYEEIPALSGPTQVPGTITQRPPTDPPVTRPPVTNPPVTQGPPPTPTVDDGSTVTPNGGVTLPPIIPPQVSPGGPTWAPDPAVGSDLTIELVLEEPDRVYKLGEDIAFTAIIHNNSDHPILPDSIRHVWSFTNIDEDYHELFPYYHPDPIPAGGDFKHTYFFATHDYNVPPLYIGAFGVYWTEDGVQKHADSNILEPKFAEDPNVGSELSITLTLDEPDREYLPGEQVMYTIIVHNNTDQDIWTDGFNYSSSYSTYSNAAPGWPFQVLVPAHGDYNWPKRWYAFSDEYDPFQIGPHTVFWTVDGVQKHAHSNVLEPKGGKDATASSELSVVLEMEEPDRVYGPDEMIVYFCSVYNNSDHDIQTDTLRVRETNYNDTWDCDYLISPGEFVRITILAYPTKDDPTFQMGPHTVYWSDNGVQKHAYSNVLAPKREWPEEKEKEKEYDLTLASDYIHPEELHLPGDKVPITYTVTNTGSKPLDDFCWCYMGYSAGTDFHEKAPEILYPGDSFQFTMVTLISEDEKDKTAIHHELCVASMNQVKEEGDYSLKVVLSNHVNIELGIGSPEEKAPDLLLLADVVSPKANYANGEEVEIHWAMANVGDRACVFSGVTGFPDTAPSFLAKAGAGEILYPYAANQLSGTCKVTVSGTPGGVMNVLFQGYGDNGACWSNVDTVTLPIRQDGFDWETPEDPTVNGGITLKADPSIYKMAEPSDHLNLYVVGEDIHFTASCENLSTIPLDMEVVINVNDADTNISYEILGNMMPHEERDHHGFYKVNGDDKKQKYITAVAMLMWKDPVSGLQRQAKSNTLILSVMQGDPPEPPTTTESVYEGLTISQAEVSAPGPEGFYVKDDEIQVQYTVHNGTTQAFHDVWVSSDLTGSVDHFDDIAPGEDRTGYYYYTVTEMDTFYPFIYSTAAVVGRGEMDGEKYMDMSNTLTFPVGIVDTVEVPEPQLEVRKVETSTPKKHNKFYQKGETITYSIIVTNTGSTLIDEVRVYDSLKLDNFGEIASIENLYPSSSRSYTFAYEVTQPDVDTGWVTNFAWCDYSAGSFKDTAVSLPVYSSTGEIIPPPTLIPPVTPSPGDPWDPGKITPPTHRPDDGDPGKNVTVIQDGREILTRGNGEPCCYRQLVMAGDGVVGYELHTCARHSLAAAAMDRAEAAPAEQQAALYQRAGELWQEQLALMSNELVKAASGQAIYTVMNERVLFSAQLATWRKTLETLYVGDPAMVEKQIADLLMNRVIDMCDELYSAPQARRDSLRSSIQSSGLPAGDGRCVLSMEGSQRILFFGSEHADIAEQALMMVRRLDNPADNAKKAAYLWTGALNSMTNARYLAVEGDARQVVSADRMAFGNWLTAREALLNLLYPDNLEIVNEVLMQIVQQRALALCAGSK